jgi:hypothetical protein
MAYDPNDPEDKKIVAKLIKDAVDAALSEATTEHEADLAGLKAKNKELLAKIAKGESNPADIAKLEDEIEALKTQVKESAKTVTKLTKERDEAAANYDKESKYSADMLRDNGLTEALLSNNVAKHFLPAAKALLAGQVSIKPDGDKRLLVVGDKPLGDFVKEWSQGDDGKHYVAAPNNSGTNAPGGQASGGGKTMTRDAYNKQSISDPAGTAKFFSEGGTLVD